MFGSFGIASAASSMIFLSKAAADGDIASLLGLHKRVCVTSGTRHIGEKDLIHNHYRPVIEVDPQTYSVWADG